MSSKRVRSQVSFASSHQNSSRRTLPSTCSTEWKGCTGGETGFDAAVIEKCASGDEGKLLLEKSFKVAQALGIGASPTWVANGRYKFSGIDAETIKTNFCKHNKLPGCKNKLEGKAAGPAPKGCGG